MARYTPRGYVPNRTKQEQLMERHNHDDPSLQDESHEMTLTGRALTQNAISATLHRFTRCAIGEVLGMVVGTAAGVDTAPR